MLVSTSRCLDKVHDVDGLILQEVLDGGAAAADQPADVLRADLRDKLYFTTKLFTSMVSASQRTSGNALIMSKFILLIENTPLSLLKD